MVRSGPSHFSCRCLSEGLDPDRTLTFRTLGGNIAASIKWNCTGAPTGLPEAVLCEIRCLGFECPFEPMRVSNLRLIKPDGALLDASPEAPPLGEQLASHAEQ